VIIGLIILGILFGAAAINGTISTQGGKTGLGDQLNADLFGTAGSAGSSGSAGTSSSPGVLKWFGAMIVLAAIFKMMKMPGTGKAFAVLVLIAYFAKNPNIPTQISTAIGGLQAPSPLAGAGGAAGAGPGGGVMAAGLGAAPGILGAGAGLFGGNPGGLGGGTSPAIGAAFGSITGGFGL
jgi:hypothetical protein